MIIFVVDVVFIMFIFSDDGECEEIVREWVGIVWYCLILFRVVIWGGYFFVFVMFYLIVFIF